MPRQLGDRRARRCAAPRPAAERRRAARRRRAGAAATARAGRAELGHRDERGCRRSLPRRGRARAVRPRRRPASASARTMPPTSVLNPRSRRAVGEQHGVGGAGEPRDRVDARRASGSTSRLSGIVSDSPRHSRRRGRRGTRRGRRRRPRRRSYSQSSPSARVGGARAAPGDFECAIGEPSTARRRRARARSLTVGRVLVARSAPVLQLRRRRPRAPRRSSENTVSPVSRFTGTKNSHGPSAGCIAASIATSPGLRDRADRQAGVHVGVVRVATRPRARRRSSTPCGCCRCRRRRSRRTASVHALVEAVLEHAGDLVVVVDADRPRAARARRGRSCSSGRPARRRPRRAPRTGGRRASASTSCASMPGVEACRSPGTGSPRGSSPPRAARRTRRSAAAACSSSSGMLRALGDQLRARRQRRCPRG